MTSGTNSVAVVFSSALPSSSYRVSVMVTSGNGYATAPLLQPTECLYFNATSKTTTGFTIQHRLCSTGALSNVDENAVLDWIAIESN